MSKLNTAIEIVKANSDKKEAINSIMEELSVTKANAFVYWFKAAKALNLPTPVKTKVATEETVVRKVAKRKINPVTETSPEKAAAKIAEIDAVIAGLKTAGAASPFPVAA